MCYLLGAGALYEIHCICFTSNFGFFICIYISAEILALVNLMGDLVVDCNREFHAEYHCMYLRIASLRHMTFTIASHAE